MTPEFKALLKKHPGPWLLWPLRGSRYNHIYDANGCWLAEFEDRKIARAIVSLTKKKVRRGKR